MSFAGDDGRLTLPPNGYSFISQSCSWFVHAGPFCELGRREPGKARVQPRMIVVVAPVRDDLASVVKTAEQVLVETLAPQPHRRVISQSTLLASSPFAHLLDSVIGEKVGAVASAPQGGASPQRHARSEAPN